MKLPSYLDFSANIRTHGTFVGVLLIVNAIVTLLLGAVQKFMTEDLPEELNNNDYQGETLLIAGALKTLVTVMFWIGFLKRKRWCLTVFIVLLDVSLALLYLALIGAIIVQNIFVMCSLLIALAVSKYFLLVTLQLREANSNGMVLLENCEVENPIVKLGGETLICKLQVS